MTHNWLDLGVLVVLIVFVGLGLWAGLVRSLFRLLAWAGGAAASWFGSAYVMVWLAQNVAPLPPYVARFSATFFAFLVPFMVLSLIGYAAHKMISASPLGPANRMGGGLLGLVKGLILCGLLFTLLHWIPAKGTLQDTLESSVAYDFYLLVYVGLYEQSEK